MRFFEGETINIRDLNGTEILFHRGCFCAWKAEDKTLRDLFGEEVMQDITVSERVHRAAQVDWIASDVG